MKNLNIELNQEIEHAKKVKEANNMTFATIWLTGKKSFGFNFDPKPIGYTVYEFGIKRKVVAVV